MEAISDAALLPPDFRISVACWVLKDHAHCDDTKCGCRCHT